MGYNQFEKKNKNIKAENLIVGIEHNTMYYYQIKNDSLLLLGHENPVVKLQYVKPYVVTTYPLNYGMKIGSQYATQGLYSGTEHIQTTGMIETHADAYGKIILPAGDTINPVLRIKTIQTIEDKLDDNFTEKHLETYKWYTKGYRYPIFETIRNIDTKNDSILFATSFYYPPQDHLYLDTDLENQRILDEMWDMQNRIDNNASQPHTKTIEQIITYRTYPNPVENTLYLNYTLTEPTNITLSIYSIIDGKIYYQSKKQQKQIGDHTENISCHIMPSGTYILQILIDNQLPITSTIIKK